jgi:hypothetical protein
MFTQLSIVVDDGGGTKSTIVIPLSTTSGDPNIALTQAQAVARVGFWDSNQQNYYPAAAIRKITPA